MKRSSLLWVFMVLAAAGCLNANGTEPSMTEIPSRSAAPSPRARTATASRGTATAVQRSPTDTEGSRPDTRTVQPRPTVARSTESPDSVGTPTQQREPTPAPVDSPVPTREPTPFQPELGSVYYVRPDGGSTAQCTGLVDAPYPGSGTGQPCAWDHPFRALPPGRHAAHRRRRHADHRLAAAYRMGYGAPGAGDCEADGAYDCHMPPIPSGPDPAAPRASWARAGTPAAADPPELWGTERPWFIVNLTDSSNVELACLEITDHSTASSSPRLRRPGTASAIPIPLATGPPSASMPRTRQTSTCTT